MEYPVQGNPKAGVSQGDDASASRTATDRLTIPRRSSREQTQLWESRIDRFGRVACPWLPSCGRRSDSRRSCCCTRWCFL